MKKQLTFAFICTLIPVVSLCSEDRSSLEKLIPIITLTKNIFEKKYKQSSYKTEKTEGEKTISTKFINNPDKREVIIKIKDTYINSLRDTKTISFKFLAEETFYGWNRYEDKSCYDDLSALENGISNIPSETLNEMMLTMDIQNLKISFGPLNYKGEFEKK
jgi:hypothetical protein